MFLSNGNEFTTNTRVVKKSSNKPPVIKDANQKYKMINDIGKKLAGVCSLMGSTDFQRVYNEFKMFYDNVKDGKIGDIDTDDVDFSPQFQAPLEDISISSSSTVTQSSTCSTVRQVTSTNTSCSISLETPSVITKNEIPNFSTVASDILSDSLQDDIGISDTEVVDEASEREMKMMDNKVIQLTETDLIFSCTNVYNDLTDIVNSEGGSWRHNVYFNRHSDETIKKHHLAHYFHSGAFTESQLDTCMNWLCSSFPTLTLNYLTKDLLPDLLEKIVVNEFNCDKKAAEKYLDEGGAISPEKLFGKRKGRNTGGVTSVECKSVKPSKMHVQSFPS